LDPSAYLQRKERAVANVFLRVEIAERRSLVCEPAPRLRPDQAGEEVDGAWRSLRDAAGLPRFRFHDLRHTVVTDLLEAGEPEHVIQAVTGQLSKKMLEHYSHQRLKAKGQMLAR
jgi:integrase